MRALAVLQKRLRDSIPSVHAKRLDALTAIIGSAVSGGRLSLSALGRSLDSGCAVRHRIKRVDRLLGNVQLHQERLSFYKLLCDLLIGSRREPILIVDWSDLKPGRHWLLLRATVWVHGFALPVYEEIHPLRRLNNRRVQRDFLLTLQMLLGEGVRPIVVADAGFRSPWFQDIERLGWHWVGRVRNRTLIQIAGTWRHCRKLYPQATAVPRDLGVQTFTRTNPISGRLCLYHQPPKGRHDLIRCGRASGDTASRKSARRQREPWVIAAAPSLNDRTALDLINLYRVRMRIEHSFRTLKSHRFGFAFEDSQTRSAERIGVLLLIHALALLLAWIAGWAAQRTGLQHQLKSNAGHGPRAGLSIITLGLMALTLLRMPLSAPDFAAALHSPLTPPLLDIHRRI